MQKDPGLLPLHLSALRKKLPTLQTPFLRISEPYVPNPLCFPHDENHNSATVQTGAAANSTERCTTSGMGLPCLTASATLAHTPRQGSPDCSDPPSFYLKTLTTLITLYIVLSLKCCGMLTLDSSIPKECFTLQNIQF